MAESKFIEACKGGKLQKVKAAINKEIDVNCSSGKQFEGKTALILASENNHSSIVTLLLENGANVDTGDKYGMTALHYAAFKGNSQICQILIAHNADIDCYDKASLTPLHEAASSGKGGVIKVLLKAGASVILTDRNNKTALDLATEYNRTTCIKYLNKGLEKHNKRMAKKRHKYTSSNEVKDNEVNLNALHSKKTNKRAVSQYMGNGKGMLKDRTNTKKSKRMTDTDRMANFATQLNLFGDKESEKEIDTLKQQIAGLKHRIKKLQNDKEKLKEQMQDAMEDNKEVTGLREELQGLAETISIIEDENEAQDRDIQQKERELSKVNQQMLKQKHKFEKEKKDLTKKYKAKIQAIEQKYATKVVPDDEHKRAEDEDINGIIEECGDSVSALKDKLYEVMKIMKRIDGENDTLKEEITDLNKKHSKKVDALLNNYTAVREELGDRHSMPTTPELDNDESQKRGHRRKNSKVLRKIDRFTKWIESEVALPQYIDNFHEFDYDRIDVVKGLTDSDLKEIGIKKLGHRRLICEKIQELIDRQDSKSQSQTGITGISQLIEQSASASPVQQPATIVEDEYYNEEEDEEEEEEVVSDNENENGSEEEDNQD